MHIPENVKTEMKAVGTMKVTKTMNTTKVMGVKMNMKMILMRIKTMYLDAVRGRLMALKRRSETAKLNLRSDY